MEKLTIDGKISSLERVRREKSEGIEEKGKITIDTEEGRVTVIGDADILTSYKPDLTVTITLSKTNKTLKESVQSESTVND